MGPDGLGTDVINKIRTLVRCENFWRLQIVLLRKYITCSHSLTQILENYTLGTVHMGEVSKYFLSQIH